MIISWLMFWITDSEREKLSLHDTNLIVFITLFIFGEENFVIVYEKILIMNITISIYVFLFLFSYDSYLACNAILQNPQGVYTIKNFGRKTNCSVSIMFPESFQIISTDIGVRVKEGDSNSNVNNNTIETGLMREVGFQ